MSDARDSATHQAASRFQAVVTSLQPAARRLVSPFQGLIWGLGWRTWRPGALPQAIESEPFRLSPLPLAVDA